MTFQIDSYDAPLDDALPSVTSVPAVRQRMAQDFLLTSAEGRNLTLIVVGVDNLEAASDIAGVSEEELMQQCRRLLNDASAPAAGPVHAYRDGARLIALYELSLDQVEELAQRTILAARELCLDDARVRLALSAGVAENRPDVELFFETLVAVAEEGLAVARARGGECCVHTMLYRSLQEMAERDETALSNRPKAARVVDARVSPPASAPTVQREPDPKEASTAQPLATSSEPAANPLVEQELLARAREMAQELKNEALSELRLDFERRLEAERELRIELERATNSTVDVEHLKRRIRKLAMSLEKTEERLREVSMLKNVDPGMSSIYREVQGLASEDQGFEVKRQMMRHIFEANLLIQKQAG